MSRIRLPDAFFDTTTAIALDDFTFLVRNRSNATLQTIERRATYGGRKARRAKLRATELKSHMHTDDAIPWADMWRALKQR